MKLKKICYILNVFPLPSETFISGEAASMLDIGVTPFVFSHKRGDLAVVQPSAQKLFDADLVTYLQPLSKRKQIQATFKCILRKPWKASLCFAKALVSRDRWMYFWAAPYAVIILDKNVQFIHAHFADTNFALAEVLSSWTGVPFGVTTHGYDLRNDPLPIHNVRKLFKKCDLIVTISEWNKRFMAQKYSIASKNIKVVHCGVDIDRFKSVVNSTRFQKKTLKMINIGRLVPEKGQDILLQALAIARAKGVQFEMTIIGSGPLRESLINLTRDLQLDDCVCLVGAQPQSYVIETLQQSDLFILSSRSEGLPIVGMEAMATGVLMIASRINGIPELVEHQVNGLLVGPENIDELANAIIWAEKNKSALMKMSVAARMKVETEFCRKSCSELLAVEFARTANLEGYGGTQ